MSLFHQFPVLQEFSTKVAGGDLFRFNGKSRLIDNVAEVGYSPALLHGSSPPILDATTSRPFFCLGKDNG